MTLTLATLSFLFTIQPSQINPEDRSLLELAKASRSVDEQLQRFDALEMKYKFSIFKQVLDRIRIKVYTTLPWSLSEPSFIRTFNEPDFNEPIKYYGVSVFSWYSAVARCDDSQFMSQIDARADIVFGLYYCPYNSQADNITGWGDDPVFAFDTYLAGAFNKQIYFDNFLVRTYRPNAETWNAGQTFWLRGIRNPDGSVDFTNSTEFYPPISP